MDVYIKKEPLLQLAKELQGHCFGAPLIVKAIEDAPIIDIKEIQMTAIKKFVEKLETKAEGLYPWKYVVDTDDIDDAVKEMEKNYGSADL